MVASTCLTFEFIIHFRYLFIKLKPIIAVGFFIGSRSLNNIIIVSREEAFRLIMQLPVPVVGVSALDAH